MVTILNMPFAEWSPFIFILLAGTLPTDSWRWLGVLLSRRLQEDGELIKWVKAVATALVAALVAKLVLFPTGSLAAVPIILRGSAILFGGAVFFATKQRLLPGILAAEVALLGSIIALQPSE